MLKSRKLSPEAFERDFFATLTPGVIPRNQFIDWAQIKTKCASYADEIEFFQGLTRIKPEKLAAEISGSLLSADDPSRILKGGFELLGHTNDYYVSNQDEVDFKKLSSEIENGSEKVAGYCANLLLDLGLKNLLGTGNLSSAFVGIQVGLESNRRKSVGGKHFGLWVRELLESTCGLLGTDYSVKPEENIPYEILGEKKRVDFAIFHKGKIRIAVEVNFYTTSGSKPSEIKRAYADVNRELEKVGIVLVWVTDGAGYHKMKKGIVDAFRIHPNTYNYNMARSHLKADILDAVGK